MRTGMLIAVLGVPALVAAQKPVKVRCPFRPFHPLLLPGPMPVM
jgi:hypothetical protein